MFEKIALCGCLAALTVLPSCSPAEEPGSKPAATTAALPGSYWLAAAPAGALDIKQARQSGKDGAEIVVVGRVGDLLAKRAQFKLVDRSFVPCNERPEDECKTPWDYCCEDPTDLAKGTIVIECRDGDQLRKVTAKGFHGLDHLKEVVVKGRVIKDSAGNVILVAAGMHVKS